MGKFGPIFGFIFYMLVFIAAITSSIALLEAICSTVMDKELKKGKPMNRKSVVNLIGLIVCRRRFRSTGRTWRKRIPAYFRTGHLAGHL